METLNPDHCGRLSIPTILNITPKSPKLGKFTFHGPYYFNKRKELNKNINPYFLSVRTSVSLFYSLHPLDSPDQTSPSDYKSPHAWVTTL